MTLSVSVVSYRSDYATLIRTLNSLDRAVAYARQRGLWADAVRVFLVDNSGDLALEALEVELAASELALEPIVGQGNVGYGRGNNLAIERTCSDYHLVLNPDVDMAEDALACAVDYLARHEDVVALSPSATGKFGEKQYLCRRYPAIADLLVRGGVPSRLRGIFQRRLASYELRSEIDEADRENAICCGAAYLSPLIISGCFMFYRTSVLKALGGFDRRYFLYFEDYDLSVRTSQSFRIAYVPAVRIRHFGGNAALKGWRHIRLFSTSAFFFFSRFGWKWL
jgi:GT2 family glycosyltransferase